MDLWSSELYRTQEFNLKKEKKKEISNNIQDRIFLQNKNFWVLYTVLPNCTLLWKNKTKKTNNLTSYPGHAGHTHETHPE